MSSLYPISFILYPILVSLARKIFSNTAWQIFGKAVTAVLGIVSIKFITNYLSPGSYGEYTTIYDYTALFAIVADFGLFTIAVREMAHEGDKNAVEKIVGNVLSIRTALAVCSLGLGILTAFVIPAYRDSHIPFGVLIVSAATILTLIAGTMSSVLQFYLRMKWASIALTAGKVVTVAYILITIIWLFPGNPDTGFPHLLLAWILGGMVTIAITYIASRKFVSIAFQFDFAFWKKVFVKALPYGLALVLGTVYFRMGTIVLSLFKLKDQVGYYGVPMRFLEILQIIPHYFMNSVLPVLTMSLKNSDGSERSVRIVRYSINALAALALPIFIGGYLLAWPITAAVSNPEFLSHRVGDGIVWGSDLALKILLLAISFTYLHVVFSYTLVAMGKQMELLAANGIVAIINVALNFLLAPRFGFVGASVSAVAAEGIMFIILFLKIRRQMRYIWDFSFLIKTLFSAAIMGTVLYLAADYFNERLFSKSLFVLIPLGGVVFISIMLFTKAITREMLALFRKTDVPKEEA